MVPFDRMAIVLAEDGVARVVAAAGAQADDVMPPGTVQTLERNLLADVVERGQTIVRRDMRTRGVRGGGAAARRSVCARASLRRCSPARGRSG